MRRRTLLLLLALLPALLASALLASPTWAGWVPNGVLICQARDQRYGVVQCSDQLGGAFIGWQDDRSGTAEAYLHHVLASGDLASGWPLNGLGVKTGGYYQFPWAMAPDGQGGVLYVYANLPDYDIWLSHITAAGQPVAGWPLIGVPVCTAPGFASRPGVADDGSGGAFVVWHDERAGPQAYMQHITSAGNPADGWPINGRPLPDPYSLSGGPFLISDGGGGVFVAWTGLDPATNLSDLRMQHFSSAGVPVAGWPDSGAVMSLVPNGRAVTGLAPDGAGGVYAVWDDDRGSPGFHDPRDWQYHDIYAQHVRADGSVAPGWPVDGLPLCTAYGTQQFPTLAADGSGGMIAAWEDYRNGLAQVYALRVDGSGQRLPGWPQDGQPLSDYPGYQLSPKVAGDGAGGGYISIVVANTNYRVAVQHVRGDGGVAPGWGPEGIYVADAGDQSGPAITADGTGGAIVAWSGYYGSVTSEGIYAQRFAPDGPVPVALSLVSAEVVGDVVRLAWQVGGTSAGLAYVERHTETSSWIRLGEASADGTGRISYVDHDVLPGTRYGYRLVLSDAASSTSSETWVEVPALRFALAGAVPNPARGTELKVAFTLAEPGAVRLECLDVTGRVVRVSEPGVLEPGRHLLPLPGAALSPGVYWLRLTQGPRTATARAILVE